MQLLRHFQSCLWTNARMASGRAVRSAVCLHHSSGQSFHLLQICIRMSTYLYRTSLVHHPHCRIASNYLGYDRPCGDNTVFQPYSLFKQSVLLAAPGTASFMPRTLYELSAELHTVHLWIIACMPSEPVLMMLYCMIASRCCVVYGCSAL